MNNNDKFNVISADIGGSHITAGLIDLSNRSVVVGTMFRAEVDSKGSAEEILSIWKSVVNNILLAGGYDVKRLAFAMPGPFDYEKGISLIKGVDKYDSLYGIDIRNEFAEYFDIPASQVLFRNDAESFLHGEVAVGNFNATDKILGFTLGTGFGSAYSYLGDTKDMSIGLLPFKESITDDYLTTRWFRNAYEEKSGQFLNVEKISTLARQGDRMALQLFDEFADNLAEVIDKQIKNTGATHIVLGGNISKAQQLFIPRIQKQLNSECIFSLAQLGEQSAIVGSAYLFASLFDLI